MAGRACAVWPPNQRAAPSNSQAQRSSRRRRSAGITRSRSLLEAMITRRAYRQAAPYSSICAEPGTFDAR
jgi:hypothetical protein